MHFCFITCPFQFTSIQLRCARPNSPAPLANDTALLQTIGQRSHSKDSPGEVTSQNPLVKHETGALQGYWIRHQRVEVCDCRARGFGKVLVLQHPKGYWQDLSITLQQDHLSVEFVRHQAEQQP